MPVSSGHFIGFTVSGRHISWFVVWGSESFLVSLKMGLFFLALLFVLLLKISKEGKGRERCLYCLSLGVHLSVTSWGPGCPRFTEVGQFSYWSLLIQPRAHDLPHLKGFQGLQVLSGAPEARVRELLPSCGLPSFPSGAAHLPNILTSVVGACKCSQ